MTTDLTAENARLRAALAFYSDEHNCGYDVGVTNYGLSCDVGEIIRDGGNIARAALATPAPDVVQEAAIDIEAIENGDKRWHGEDHRVVAVRWEPYKPDGQRQMKAKGRWQEQVGSGDYWRWQNCDRPTALRAIAGDRT